ncbi:MAG: hypothetical protein ACKOWF_07525 [Chloroflexota bacterium]
MDSSRFDAMIRDLAAGESRRSVLGAAGAGLLAALGFAGPAAAKCGKNKPCGECRRCKKGKCKKKPDGAQCSGGTCQRGQCAASCTPSCAGRECGGNGCGGSCGSCPATESCNASGICVCTPDCAGKVCGDDGCGGSCGSCAANQTCSDGACQCVPSCGGRNCGPDGCGGSCGSCVLGNSCSGGQCGVPPTCDPPATFCIDALDCCSSFCNNLGLSGVCRKSSAGDPCFADDDCFDPLVCRGWICAPALAG